MTTKNTLIKQLNGLKVLQEKHAKEQAEAIDLIIDDLQFMSDHIGDKNQSAQTEEPTNDNDS